MSRRTLTSLIGLAVLILIFEGNKLSSVVNLSPSVRGTSQEAAAYSMVPNEPVSLFVEPDSGIAPIIAKITSAKSSIDLVMYELEDTDVEQALVTAENHGVHVRVLLSGGQYGAGSSANAKAYAYLQSHSVPVRWTPSYFALTHQKTLIIDDSDALIMTFNMTPKYYVTSRDFAIDDPDARDVLAIEQAFTDDWNNTKDRPATGDDLLWSPGSKTALLAIIESAKKSLLIYNEELSDPDIIAALQSAAARGVTVRILMTDQSSWHAAFTAITNAGGEVRTYASKASLYIHAKMILADDAQAFVGSENFSTASLLFNRELGLFISNPTVLSELQSTFESDWANANPYQ